MAETDSTSIKKKTQLETQTVTQAVKRPRKSNAGRPSKYTEDIAIEICARLAEGEPMTKITRDNHIPHPVTVYRWLIDNLEFRNMYESARKDGAHTLASQIQEIADETPLEVFDEAGNKRYDSGSISHNKLRVEARKWLAAKYLPRVYGDRQILAGDADSPVELNHNGAIFDGILTHMQLKRQVDEG